MVRLDMIKRNTALLLAMVLLFVLVAACAKAQAGKKDLTEGMRAKNVDTSGALTEDALRSMAAFSADLFRKTAALGKENTLVSPVSVFLALGMVANGADKETLAAFEEALGRYGLSLKELNLAYKALGEELQDAGGSTVLNIANSIWYNEGFTPKEDFLQINADYYGAAAYRSDFAKKETIGEINKWIEEKTKGLIPKMIDEIDSQAIMLLFNTLYLKAAWKAQFDAADNYDGTFTLADGSLVKATFMGNGLREETYLSLNGARGVLLPYDDGKLAYIAILPPEGTSAKEYISSLDEEAVMGLIGSAKQTKVQLSLPKYTAAFEAELNDVLSDMGLSPAFDSEKADFSKMGSADGNIYIGRVLHKTCIKVNELGTEAAAATGIEMRATSMPADEYETLTFNRPFVYAVVDLNTGLPLFLGAMDNPAV